jgi:hypothetical protein
MAIFKPQIYNIYLTGPESTFCPLFLFFDKKNLVALEKMLLSSKQTNLEHFLL